MTLYAGETLIITNSMTLDGDPVEVADVDSVDIIIYDSEGEEVLSQTPMSWNASDERFEYQWDTSPSGTALEPGTYRAKIIVFGLAGEENWEFMRIRLARNPVE